jgi:quercetin 2,3-dioxygenase
MKPRKVKQTIEPQYAIEGAGVLLRRSFGPNRANLFDPFLLFDHFAFNDPQEGPIRGFPTHPHRGIETVTYMLEGNVRHRDSIGNMGVIGPGDVQWMTAASGVLHREYHEASYARRGGPFQMAQLWVNLPRAHKLDPPRYQALQGAEMGLVTLPDGAGVVRIIAGEFGGVKGPARTFTPVTLLDVRLHRGGAIELSFPAHENAAFLVMKGELSLSDGEEVREGDLVVFRREGERIALAASSEAQLLVLGGEPIDEPIARYGPFVMNTELEIHQAMADLKAGKFGRLDD